MTKKILIAVLAIMVLAAVGIGSYMMGQSNGLTQAENIRSEFFQSRSGNTGGQGTTGQPASNARSQLGRPAATGTVKSIDGDVLQVTEQDGTIVTVAVTGQTQVQKTSPGTVADLKVGQQITVQGALSTGQVNAQLIQITSAAP